MSDKTALLSLCDEPWLDIDTGIESSGSTKDYLHLLEIYYRDIDNKAALLESYFAEQDYENYTIKVHALKSSSRLIGATDFGEKARLLEESGKNGDYDYIRSHHTAFITELLSFVGPLGAVFDNSNDTSKDKNSQKPVASPELMQQVFDDLSVAADDMDCDAIDHIISEMNDYRINDSFSSLWEKILSAANEYEYEELYNLTSRR